MKLHLLAMVFMCILLCVSCSRSTKEYTPKPRGYFRIELPQASYQVLPLDSLPYSFNVSQLATVELPEAGSHEGWINLSYPSLKVKVYCSYLPVTPSKLQTMEDESRLLVSRQAKQANAVKEQAYSNPGERVYGSLFLLDGESPSPVQFMLTDSVSHFFRGALYYDCVPNADSLAPVTDYLRKDIIELIQSFTWKK